MMLNKPIIEKIISKNQDKKKKSRKSLKIRKR